MSLRFLLPILLLPIAATAAPAPEGVTHLRTLDGIEEYTLESNGLRVLLMPMEDLPVATVMVTYAVGSRNEGPGTTGATHILEHMMFKGTEKFRTEDGTDYSSQMERIGARSNATTWFDRTNYFATLPSEHVPLAVEIEADRMRNLLIREADLASEMTVVRNEYERGENNPVRTLLKEIYGVAFLAHPYSHPTIGWLSDIEATSPEKLRAFYDTFYWPDNATLSVIGGFDRTETLRAIERYYGPIPRSPGGIPAVETTEPEQSGPRRVTIRRAGQLGVVATAYKAPEGTHADWAALSVVEQILAADKTGRLYRALEDPGLATATFTHAPMLRDPGLFLLAAYLAPETGHAEAEEVLRRVIEEVAAEGVTAEEVARAKSVLRAQTLYGRDGPYAIAGSLNEAIAMGDWTSYLLLPEMIGAVTADDVRTVAARYFREASSTTGWFVPEKTLAEGGPPATGAAAGPVHYRDPEASGEAPFPAAAVHFSRGLHETTVGPIRLVTLDLPVEGIVSFAGSLAAGDRFSPADNPMLAELTAAMLDKGTRARDRFELAAELEELGASIAFGTDAHSLVFSGRFLGPDAGQLVDLLAAQLRDPAFDPEVLESVRQRQLGALLHAADDTYYRANNAALRLAYPPGHPEYVPPLEELTAAVEGTDAAALRAFHEDVYGPASMILVFAGDVKGAGIEEAVRQAFGDWEGGRVYADDHPEPVEAGGTVGRVSLADKASIDFRMIQPTGLRRTDPDYLPFMTGNYILGGSHESRLPDEVREKRGLTYHIRTFHRGDLLTPGYWTVGGSFAPAALDEGLEVTRAVIRQWYEEGVSAEEVEAALLTLRGSYLVGLSTTAAVAGQVHSYLLRGLDAAYIDDYPERLAEVTADEVNRVIRQRFDPEAAVLALAGTLPGDPASDGEEGAVPAADAPAPREITVRLDTPDAGWRIVIESVHRTEKSLLVLSRLERADGMAAQVITTVSDRVTVPDASGLPVRHFITGKTWGWGDYPDITFIDSTKEIEATLARSEPVFRRTATNSD